MKFGRTSSGIVVLTLSGEEVERAIDAYLMAHGVRDALCGREIEVTVEEAGMHYVGPAMEAEILVAPAGDTP